MTNENIYNEEKGILSGVIATNDLDAHGTKLSDNALKQLVTDGAGLNLNMNHDQRNMDSVLGAVEDVKLKDNKVFFQAKILEEKRNKIKDWVDNKIHFGFSFGGLPGGTYRAKLNEKGERIIDNIRPLTHFSVVALPSNSETMDTGAYRGYPLYDNIEVEDMAKEKKDINNTEDEINLAEAYTIIMSQMAEFGDKVLNELEPAINGLKSQLDEIVNTTDNQRWNPVFADDPNSKSISLEEISKTVTNLINEAIKTNNETYHAQYGDAIDTLNNNVNHIINQLKLDSIDNSDDEKETKKPKNNETVGKKVKNNDSEEESDDSNNETENQRQFPPNPQYTPYIPIPINYQNQNNSEHYIDKYGRDVNGNMRK